MSRVGFFYPTLAMAQVAFQGFQVADPLRKNHRKLEVTLPEGTVIGFFAVDSNSADRIAGLHFSAMVPHPSLSDQLQSYLKAYLREPN